jgi:hypothetical protein
MRARVVCKHGDGPHVRVRSRNRRDCTLCKIERMRALQARRRIVPAIAAMPRPANA